MFRSSSSILTWPMPQHPYSSFVICCPLLCYRFKFNTQYIESFELFKQACHRRFCHTWLMSVCDPFKADTRGSISIGKYGSSELRRTGTVRQSSTNKSFICCLCKPLWRLFRPVTVCSVKYTKRTAKIQEAI
jgi:hypothetical protein